MALKRSVAELSAIGRNINQLTLLAHQGSKVVGPTVEDLRMLLKVCEAMRDHIKELVKVNARSWETGYANVPS